MSVCVSVCEQPVFHTKEHMKLKFYVQVPEGHISNPLDFGVNRCIDELGRGQRSNFGKFLIYLKRHKMGQIFSSPV